MPPAAPTHVPLLAAGLLTGVIATTAMTASTALERRLRPALDHPVDYDASDAPVTAAARVLHVAPHTRWQRRALFALVHWGYGSLVGTGQVALRRRLQDDRAATGVFYAGVQAMAFALLPTLGGTPPPWRWRRDMFATSLAQHAVYAGVAGVTAHAIDGSR